VVVVVAGVDVDVDVDVELGVVVVVVELVVELDVELVDVEPVLLVVVSASRLNGPAVPALAKEPSTASAASANAAANVLMRRCFTKGPPSRS
jgi:hypothetical protein